MSFTVDRLMAPITDRKPVVVKKSVFQGEPGVRLGGNFKKEPLEKGVVKTEDGCKPPVSGSEGTAGKLLENAAKKEKGQFAAGKNSTEKSSAKEDSRHVETFVAVIAQAILSAPGKRMTLSSIYNYIASNYSHFNREKGPGWRNSVRHNLSSNDCFVKAGRAENGKGHYWMVHPKDLPEFSKGNFRRRRKPRRPRCHHAVMFNNASDNGYYYHTLAGASIPLHSAMSSPQDRGGGLIPTSPVSYGLVETGKLPLVGHYDRPQFLDMSRTGLTIPPSALFWPGEMSSRTFPKFASSSGGGPINFHQFCACHSPGLQCYYHKC